MASKKPTEELEREHLTIHKVIGAMAVLIERLEVGKEVDAAVLTDISEFMQTFADRCHHGKESYLFKLLEKKGVAVSGCPLAVLREEHEKGCSLLANLKSSSETYTCTPGEGEEPLISALHGLIELYSAHAAKEDFLLFPMVDKVLSDSEQKELSAQFTWHASEIGVDVHHAYEQLADRILDLVCGGASTREAA